MFAWCGLLLHPARPWRMRPVAEDESAPEPSAWPSLAVLVPARNESVTLPLTLPALLSQDYPGRAHVVIVDDRSVDGTASVARALARVRPDVRADVLAGDALPAGWAGKMWALDQAWRHARPAAPDLVLLCDADILLAPGALRRLVADLAARGVDLDSRMARLGCASPGERLLVPAFTWFFGLLYPFEWIADPRRATAAAAGGCVLVRASVLDAIGGFAGQRDALIDDVALGRRAKRAGARVRLAHSRSDVVSVRSGGFRGAWAMVTRSAFVQLRRSWLLLAATLAVLAVMFVAPPALVVAGALAGKVPEVALGASAWALMAGLHVPALRHFGLPAWRALLLPLVGALYGAMTLQSALQSLRGRRPAWRDAASPGQDPA